MVSKQKFLRYLTYFAIFLVIVFFVYFIKETEYVFDTPSTPGKIGFILFVIGVIWLAVCTSSYYDLKRKNRQCEAENYIFSFSRRGNEYFPAFPAEEITEFLSVYHMDITEFQRRIVEPAIVDEMLSYKKEHPAEFPEHYGNETPYTGTY